MDDLVARENELMELNAQLDRAAVMTLADAALQEHDQTKNNNNNKDDADEPKAAPVTRSRIKGKLPVQEGEGVASANSVPRRRQETIRYELNSPESEANENNNNNNNNNGVGDNDDDDMVPAQLGLEGQVRLQKARIRALNDEARKHAQRAQSLEQKLNGTQATTHALREENQKLLKQAKTRDAAVERHRKQEASLKRTVDELRNRVQELDQELRNMRVEARRSDGGAGSGAFGGAGGKDDARVQVRLSRALEEIERLRLRNQELEQDNRQADEAHERAKKKWAQEMAQQDKQKAELFGAFRKQAKLVDVLKRQKLHLEAARQLAFTEDEFCRILQAQPTMD